MNEKIKTEVPRVVMTPGLPSDHQLNAEVVLDFYNSKQLGGGCRVEAIKFTHGGKISYDIRVPVGFDDGYEIIRDIDSSYVKLKNPSLKHDSIDCSCKFAVPSLDKRLIFTENMATKTKDDGVANAVLAAMYWMQAEMLNLNLNNE